MIRRKIGILVPMAVAAVIISLSATWVVTWAVASNKSVVVGLHKFWDIPQRVDGRPIPSVTEELLQRYPVIKDLISVVDAEDAKYKSICSKYPCEYGSGTLSMDMDLSHSVMVSRSDAEAIKSAFGLTPSLSHRPDYSYHGTVFEYNGNYYGILLGGL